MNGSTRCLILLLSLAVTGPADLDAQTPRPFFVGIQPAVTVEPHYASGSFDVSVLPLVVQLRLASRSNLRVAPVANYHIGEEGGISHVGAEVALPLFLASAEETTSRSKGLFVAPVGSVARNVRETGMEYTLAVEPGYFFLLGERWGVSVGAQFGGTYFSRDEAARSHFGVKASIGRWLGP